MHGRETEGRHSHCETPVRVFFAFAGVRCQVRPAVVHLRWYISRRTHQTPWNRLMLVVLSISPTPLLFPPALFSCCQGDCKQRGCTRATRRCIVKKQHRNWTAPVVLYKPPCCSLSEWRVWVGGAVIRSGNDKDRNFYLFIYVFFLWQQPEDKWICQNV